jgi:hypothetical protein
VELALAITLLAVAAAGGYLTLRRSLARRRWIPGFAVAVALAAALFLTTLLALHRPAVPELEVANRPIEVPPDPYVTSDTCRACHPGTYASWDASYHSSMTAVASPQSVRGDFADVELRQGGWVFRLSREGDEFWVDMPELDWAGAGPAAPRVRRRVVLTTGSHHMQTYWYESGNSRALGLLPFVYNLHLERWVPRDASFIRPPEDEPASELGRWNKVCIECHVTAGRLRPTATGQDTHVAEFGIACESCHGPAAAHVAAHRDPLERYRARRSDRPDPDIVQPERLPHDRASEVCGQCHSTSIWTTQEEIDRWMAEGFAYRPGDVLADTKHVVRGKREWNAAAVQRMIDRQPDLMQNSFWSDGKNRVAGREYNDLLETPCFVRGELSCLSCHELHQEADDPRPPAEWANDQLGAGMHGDRACTQCHATYEAAAARAAHTHHAAGSSGSLCYNCHMPYTTYGLLNAVRSHQVDSPTTRTDTEIGRPNACNLCHLDRTLAWSAGHLQAWYGTAPGDLAPEHHAVAQSALVALRGDAGQRALVAWSMGWDAAQAAAGEDWPALYLAILLGDPYPAVRHIAFRSLRTLPGFADATYDFLGPEEQRHAAGNEALRVWQAQHAARGRAAPELLIEGPGAPRMDLVRHLLEERDDRPVLFAE